MPVKCGKSQKRFRLLIKQAGKNTKMDEEDPAVFYTAKLVEPIDENDEPSVEYFDKEGNNVTPLPLHTPDKDEEAIIVSKSDPRKKSASFRLRRPPKKNPIMKTLLHVTTALYSMAGLGSLEQSKAFKELNKSDDQKAKMRKKKSIRDLKMDDEFDDKKETKKGDEGRRLSHLPDSMLAKKANDIDILLVESDTIWMLNLPGTCIEIDPEAQTEENESDENEGQKEDKQDVSNYELVESWTQTLDFTKKKKGTQCDDIDVDEATTQVSMKNFLDEEKKQKKLESNSSLKQGTPRSPLPSVTDADDAVF